MRTNMMDFIQHHFNTGKISLKLSIVNPLRNIYQDANQSVSTSNFS